jgi:hypothetical protein
MGDPGNDQLRQRSGDVKIEGKLVAFLYDLLRDHLAPGTVEELVRDAEKSAESETVSYSNGWIARYAEDLARRLSA